jgi:hypothetical protein
MTSSNRRIWRGAGGVVLEGKEGPIDIGGRLTRYIVNLINNWSTFLIIASCYCSGYFF